MRFPGNPISSFGLSVFTTRVLTLALFLYCGSSNSRANETQKSREVDVIVYGSTPGGFCAAIAAAREGASVIFAGTDRSCRRDEYRGTELLRFKPYIENGYRYSGKHGSKIKDNGKSTASFRFTAPKTGQYQLLMAYSAHETRAKNIPVTVSSGSSKQTIAVDQTTPLPTGQYFRAVGTVDLQTDTEPVIQVTTANTTGFVILDAMQLLPVD